jgi:hypothetical protein
MTALAIIKQAAADGVRLVLSLSGELKAAGNDAAVNRWLPIIRECKPAIVAALQEAANDALPDPAMEARRQEVLAKLAANPTARLAMITDLDSDPEFAILAIALRDKATFEMRVPKAKYDPFLLYDLIHRHFGTVQ